ncbi:SusC/RagA family TonB-linked outer membrane protein [Rubrolithibacter danxiaensis]|uniref:SusC/RagA family TonB-linked outer membrane protein n=1 Tax=Rubrolithibacter danxiaensis TaxID=3390805 RepID=UPI003BF7CF72
MRFIWLLICPVLLLCCSVVLGQTKITHKFNNADFESVINIITKNSSYRFLYDPNDLPSKRVTDTLVDKDVLSWLGEFFHNTNHKYTLLEDNLIVISRKKNHSQTNLITGTVNDIKGNPVSSANIKAKHSNNNAASNPNGTFSIAIEPQNDTLHFSHIGFKDKEVPVSKTGKINVVLEPKTVVLDEAIITALNITKEERKVGYSVSTIRGEEISKGKESNFILGLQGRVAGLNISGTNGGPSSSAGILLRGAASMNAGSPLFILNGIPIDNVSRSGVTEYGGIDYGDGISNINADEIETITILKGAAASAMYGARAANGVINIKTKTGQKNSSFIEFNSNITFDQAVNNTHFQYIYGQGMQNKRPQSRESAIASSLLSWGEQLDGKPTIQLDGKLYPYAAVKDNPERFYRVATGTSHTIFAGGSNERAGFWLSASIADRQAIIKNSALSQKNFAINSYYQITQRLRAEINGTYINKFEKNRSYLSDAPLNPNYAITSLATSLNQKALAPGYDPITGNEITWSDDEYKTNPYFLINKQSDKNSRNRFISSATIKYDFNKNSYLQGRLGEDISIDDQLSVIPTGTAFSINKQGGLNRLNKLKSSEINAELLLHIDKNINQFLSANFIGGAAYRKRNNELSGYYGTQFNIPYLYVPSNLKSIGINYSLNELITQSLFSSIDLNVKNFLYFSGTGRYDVYSTLPEGTRGIFVPGFSGSLLFSDILKVPALDYGKFRISYAKASGEPTQPYTTQTYYSAGPSVNNIPTGDFSRGLPNTTLKPYSLKELEFGLNLKIFKQRLDIDFTYFRRKTDHEILSAEQSVTSGFTSAFVNLGETFNSGQEILIKGFLIKSRNHSWETTINTSFIKNRLVSIDGTSRYIRTGTYRPLNAFTAMVVGKPIKQIMAYDYKRDDNGTIIIGSDGIPVRGELKPMGSTLPRLFGGVSSTYSYKNASISFLTDFKFGNKVLSATEHYSYVRGLNTATISGRETGIIAKGILENGSTNNILVPAYTYYPQLANNISAISVLNGSFIKLRQITLSYTFDKNTGRNFPGKRISLDLYARNVATLLKYTQNIDPESQFSSSLDYAGIEGGSLPAVRTFGLRVTYKL